ncbi:hypothetical protein [Pyrobaculum neutrophilum]|uniref:Uncharacterized protein n=1 Tax=Pyrobaculum neutrophilum (strain DSM 2338 / JCM 9278 / NBRC 100436 / V24Sta) TaxID=444157 RepID=B1YB99_PYRNV|nr:hypothetical protein [Pyrobaculum neutrophilum]ACB39230.1 conserved hypothetical protein [Pyrobaculum neutrophilum V24Sta]
MRWWVIAGGVAAAAVVALFLLSSAGPPFDSHNYEVNYTIKLTYTVLGQTTTVTGWLLVGEGPKGNYTAYVLRLPGAGDAVYYTAAEGGRVYSAVCFGNHCIKGSGGSNWQWVRWWQQAIATVGERKTGTCSHLGYTGEYIETTGKMNLGSWVPGPVETSGTYRAGVCTVRGVPLKLTVWGGVGTQTGGQSAVYSVELDVSAVTVGPFNEAHYSEILTKVGAK